MRFTRKKKQHGDFGVVVTSLLDVNFLLIMFFLMTAHFQRESHALLELPQEKGEEQAKPDEAGLVINITAAGEIIVSNRTVSLEELREMVKEQVEKKPGHVISRGGTERAVDPLKLMIRADRNAKTQDLNRVVFMLRQAGVGTIRIATEVPQ